MDNLDGKTLADLKRWCCDKNRDHILGVIERVQVRVRRKDSTRLRYFTTRLSIFRNAVDMGAEVPDEIEVAGVVDGKMLNLTWKCSVPGCGSTKEWHPDVGVVELLQSLYDKKAKVQDGDI